MRLPHFKPPLGIARNAENVKHALLKVGIIFFHNFMNGRLMLFLGRRRFLRKLIAVYRELADRNRERMDALEYLCNVVDEPSEHLLKRRSYSEMESIDSSKALIQQQTQIWIELETARWQDYFQPAFQVVPTGSLPGQKSAEQTIAKIIGAFVGTGKELGQKALEEIGLPWVYNVALAHAFQESVNGRVAEAAWKLILPSLSALHPNGGAVNNLDNSRLHREIWAVLKKVSVYDPVEALTVGQRLKEYCVAQRWPSFPIVFHPGKEPQWAV